MQIFDKIINNLENNDKIVVTEKDIRSNYEDLGDITYFCKENNYELTKRLLNFYEEVQMVSIKWVLKENHNLEPLVKNDGYITGVINILPYHIMLNGNLDNDWKGIIWFESDDEKTTEDLKNIKPFDYFYSDNSGSACCRVVDGKVIDDLYLFGNEGGLVNLKLNIEEYILLLSKTRGFLFWQEAYLSSHNHMRTRYMHYMSKLFDDYEI